MGAGNVTGFDVSTRCAGPPLRCGPADDTPKPATHWLATTGRVLPVATDRLHHTRRDRRETAPEQSPAKPDRSCATKSGQFYLLPTGRAIPAGARSAQHLVFALPVPGVPIIHRTKDKLKAGETVVGTTAHAGSDTRFLSGAGFDFLLFDTQHSTDDIKGLVRAVGGTRGTDTSPIVRVGDLRPDPDLLRPRHRRQGHRRTDGEQPGRSRADGGPGAATPLRRRPQLRRQCAATGASSRATASTWTRSTNSS